MGENGEISYPRPRYEFLKVSKSGLLLHSKTIPKTILKPARIHSGGRVNSAIPLTDEKNAAYLPVFFNI